MLRYPADTSRLHRFLNANCCLLCCARRTYHSTRKADHTNVQWFLHDPTPVAIRLPLSGPYRVIDPVEDPARTLTVWLALTRSHCPSLPRVWTLGRLRIQTFAGKPPSINVSGITAHRCAIVWGWWQTIYIRRSILLSVLDDS